MYVLAALQVIGLAVQLGQARTIANATEAAYLGTHDEESVSIIFTTTAGAILAGLFTIAYIVLAIFNGRGNNPARVTTWAIGGIGVFCGAFSVIDSAFRRSLIYLGETPGGTDAVTVQRQVNDALPSWYNPTVITLGVIGLLTVLAVSILLALPPSNEFFRKPQQVWQPPEDASGAGHPQPGGGFAAPGSIRPTAAGAAFQYLTHSICAIPVPSERVRLIASSARHRADGARRARWPWSPAPRWYVLR